MNQTAMADNAQTHSKRAAFAEIARQHAPALLRTAKRMCGVDVDLAEDIVQDTFVSAYRAYLDGRFDGRHPSAWLTRILTNGYLYARRQNRADSGLETEDLPGDGPGVGCWIGKLPAPEQSLLDSVFSEPLERALMSLPEAQRLCVLLADVEEVPYAEVAEILGVPIGTVRSRLNRARMQMLEMLRDAASQETRS